MALGSEELAQPELQGGRVTSFVKHVRAQLGIETSLGQYWIERALAGEEGDVFTVTWAVSGELRQHQIVNLERQEAEPMKPPGG